MTSLSLDGGYLVDGVGYPLHAGYGGQHQHALLAPAHGRGLLLGDLAVPVQVHVVEGGEGAEVAGQLVPGGGVSTKYFAKIFTMIWEYIAPRNVVSSWLPGGHEHVLSVPGHADGAARVEDEHLAHQVGVDALVLGYPHRAVCCVTTDWTR